jgi:hypothetical protein
MNFQNNYFWPGIKTLLRVALKYLLIDTVPVLFLLPFNLAVISHSVPPAAVDFVDKVWNSFQETIVPRLGGDAREAVILNKDPADIGNFESVKIQSNILDSVYSELSYISWYLRVSLSCPIIMVPLLGPMQFLSFHIITCYQSFSVFWWFI